MSSQAEKAAEGKTDPVGCVWLGRAVSLRLPTSPWDVFQASQFSPLGYGVHDFYKRSSQSSISASLCPVYIFLLPGLGPRTRPHCHTARPSGVPVVSALCKKEGDSGKENWLLYDIIAVTGDDLPQGSWDLTFPEAFTSCLLTTFLIETCG